MDFGCMFAKWTTNNPGHESKMKAIEIIAQPAESKWMNAQIESFIEKRNRQIAKFNELFDLYFDEDSEEVAIEAAQMATAEVGPRPQTILNTVEQVLDFTGDREFNDNQEIARREMAEFAKRIVFGRAFYAWERNDRAELAAMDEQLEIAHRKFCLSVVR